MGPAFIQHSIFDIRYSFNQLPFLRKPETYEEDKERHEHNSSAGSEVEIIRGEKSDDDGEEREYD